MALDPATLPNDVAALKAMLVAASAKVQDLDAEIETLKLTIAKLQHDKYGASSERTSVLMDQLELQLDELVARRAQETATDEIADAAKADAAPTEPQKPVKPRGTPARRPLPSHLPRERVIVPAPCVCQSCGSNVSGGVAPPCSPVTRAWRRRPRASVRAGARRATG